MVKIAPFGVEAWLNKWEKSARYDISQSTIASLTMDELMNLDGHHGAEFYEMLNAQKMNYGWIEGSPAFPSQYRYLLRPFAVCISFHRLVFLVAKVWGRYLVTQIK